MVSFFLFLTTFFIHVFCPITTFTRLFLVCRPYQALHTVSKKKKKKKYNFVQTYIRIQRAEQELHLNRHYYGMEVHTNHSKHT